tara:strand:+ start:578 stop:754 length:177 start_codon:yes stop_codon:yes gene_type:complete
LLKYHGHWNFHEAYNLPVQIRYWFLKRLEKQLKDEQEQMKAAQKKGRSGGSSPHGPPK